MKTINKVKRQIIKMLTENTGRALCDSGDAYGRNYERNSKVTNWDELPPYTYEAYNGGINVCLNVYHYLTQMLTITEQSVAFNNQFKAYSNKNNDECDLTNMQEWAEDNHDMFSNIYTTNTYNNDTILSQVLQYVRFEQDGNEYVILQTHNGCDVRGGYSTPYIFEVKEIDSFYSLQTYHSLTVDGNTYDNYEGYGNYTGIEFEQKNLDIENDLFVHNNKAFSKVTGEEIEVYGQIDGKSDSKSDAIKPLVEFVKTNYTKPNLKHLFEIEFSEIIENGLNADAFITNICNTIEKNNLKLELN